jgi:hypothetical protein
MRPHKVEMDSRRYVMSIANGVRRGTCDVHSSRAVKGEDSIGSAALADVSCEPVGASQ